MKEQLFWNPEVDSGEWWASWAWVLIFPFYPFIPLGAWILYERYKKFPIYRENRRKTFEMTSSKLMSKVEYVGGHPLIPQATTVVIGLSETHFTIYSIDTEFEAKKTFLENYTKKENIISPIVSIQIHDIKRVGAGRPKTAREIYDEDHGYSIDVIEKSPFLSLIFVLEGHTYAMSFQNFEKQNASQEWSNQIVSLQYKARNESK